MQDMIKKQTPEVDDSASDPTPRISMFFVVWTIIIIIAQCICLFLYVDVYVSLIPAFFPLFMSAVLMYGGRWYLVCFGTAGFSLFFPLCGALALWFLGVSLLAVVLPFTLMLFFCGLFIAAIHRIRIRRTGA